MTEPSKAAPTPEEIPEETHELGPLHPPAAAPSRGKTAGTSTGAGKDLRNLDFLRAVAVMGVLFMHLWDAVTERDLHWDFGTAGVCFFFVHTALVLMWSLDRRPNTLDFYIRRAARIYPLAMLTLIVIVVGHVPVGAWTSGKIYDYNYTAPTVWQFVQHMLLVQNLFRGTMHFEGNFLLYTMWSLPVEVQMYITLPVLFFFLQRNRRVWPLLLMWVMILLFCRVSWGITGMNTLWASCFFLPGLMAFVGFSRWKARIPAWFFLPYLLVLFTLVSQAGNMTRRAAFTLVLGLTLPLFKQLPEGLVSKASWYISRYSYGIYLLHPLAFAVGFLLFHKYSMGVQIAVAMASLVLMCLPAYHLVEAPFIRWGGKVAKRFAASQEPLPPVGEVAA